MAKNLAFIDKLWGIIASAVLIRLTLPDPPPDQLRMSDFSMLALMNEMAGGLDNKAASKKIQTVIAEGIKQTVANTK